jgi:hypothetical protein
MAGSRARVGCVGPEGAVIRVYDDAGNVIERTSIRAISKGGEFTFSSRQATVRWDHRRLDGIIPQISCSAKKL